MKVRILGPINEEVRAALVALLLEAGYEVADEDDHPKDSPGEADGEMEDTGGEPEGLPDEDNDDVGVVVLAPECLEDLVLGDAVQEAVSRGCRVIGIWPQGSTDGRLPRAIEDYGASTVPWDPARLRDAIRPATSSPDWSTPDAQPRPQPPTKRNKC